MFAYLRYLALSIAVAVVVGCADPCPKGYTPDALTGSELVLLASNAIQKIKSDSDFLSRYRRKKESLAAKKTDRPVLAVAPIMNNILGENDYAAKPIVVEFQNRLRQDGFFDVVDDLCTPRLLERLLNPNSGESNEGVQNIGKYSPPDYYLRSELRRDRDGDGYLFTLTFTMMDTGNRQVVWGSMVSYKKKDW